MLVRALKIRPLLFPTAVAAAALAIALATAAPAGAEVVLWERGRAVDARPEVRIESLQLRGHPAPLARRDRRVVFHPKRLFRLTAVVESPLERDLLRIVWRLDAAGEATIDILDAAGAPVRSFPARPSAARAWESVDWDGADDTGRLVPAGVYVVRLRASAGTAPPVAERIAEVLVEPPPRIRVGDSPGVIRVDRPPEGGPGRLFVPFAAPSEQRLSAYMLRYAAREDRFEPIAHLLKDRVMGAGTLAWNAADVAPGLYYLLIVSSPETAEPLPELSSRMGAGRAVRTTLRPVALSGALTSAARQIEAAIVPALGRAAGLEPTAAETTP